MLAPRYKGKEFCTYVAADLNRALNNFADLVTLCVHILDATSAK